MANSCRGSCHSRRDLLSGIVPSSLSLHPTKVRPGGDQEVAVTGNVCPEPAVAEESRDLFCSPRGILSQGARCGQGNQIMLWKMPATFPRSWGRHLPLGRPTL